MELRCVRLVGTVCMNGLYDINGEEKQRFHGERDYDDIHDFLGCAIAEPKECQFTSMDCLFFFDEKSSGDFPTHVIEFVLSY